MKKLAILFSSIAMLSCSDNNKEEVITILQTADIHAYLNPHSELFVENDSILFRNAGGLANIKTLVESVRQENPDGTVFYRWWRSNSGKWRKCTF